MKIVKLFIPILFIFLYVLLVITTVIFFSLQVQDFNTLSIVYLKDIFSKLHVTLIPDKPIIDYLISVMGFFLTAFGFVFVVVQISALADQTNKQEEQYHKDSEFKNFLEATKMLTSTENKSNATAQISAMYLLYDFAKTHSKHNNGNLEKVIKILNKYAVSVLYENTSPIIVLNNSKFTRKNSLPTRKIINEWKEYGEPAQQVASTALELNKKLFVYALNKKFNKQIKKNLNLSGVVIFDFDIEIDIDDDKKLFDVVKNSPEMVFLCCKFSNGNKKISFSTPKTVTNINNVKGRMDISLSRFIDCDLNECDFSYSNLWCVSFENCKLNGTKFTGAECLGAEFLYREDKRYPLKEKEKISKNQLEEMLFIDDNFFKEFSKKYRADKPKLKYAVVLSGSNEEKIKEICFSNIGEYDDFVVYKNENDPESKNFLDKMKHSICQRLCKK